MNSTELTKIGQLDGITAGVAEPHKAVGYVQRGAARLLIKLRRGMTNEH